MHMCLLHGEGSGKGPGPGFFGGGKRDVGWGEVVGGTGKGVCFLITAAGTLKMVRTVPHTSHTLSAFSFARLHVRSPKIQDVR